RIPTDLAYRVYVDSLMHLPPVTASESHHIREELGGGGERNAVDQILERAAQVLGVLTNELGVAVGPSLDDAVLERLELLQVSSERLLLVLTLKSGVVRTIFVEVSSQMAREAVAQVAVVLNERLAGLTLKHIRATLPDRLRDAAASPESGAGELLNIFIQEADELFDVRGAGAGAGVAPGGVVGERLGGPRTCTPFWGGRGTPTRPKSRRPTGGWRCSTIPTASGGGRTRSTPPRSASRRSRKRTRCCVIPRSGHCTTATARAGCGAAVAGGGRRTSGSRTSTCPRRSTSSCATSAGAADSTPPSGAPTHPRAGTR